MDIILFGMQGSGKGTQGKILAQKYGLTVFEMGAELRKHIASGSSLGQRIKTIVERGDLVDNDTVMEVVQNFVGSFSGDHHILFDGIPRTAGQSEKLLALIHQHGHDAFALHIKISYDEAMKRLTQRRVCKNCKEVYPAFYEGETCSARSGEQVCGGPLVTRHDDNTEAIAKRLENYEKETLPVIKKFSEIDRLIEVDGEQSIPDVTEEMIEKAAYLFT
ncbi:MAG: nucleoside monophosphate kinase [Candidatus Peregrinibacteria bacterium]